jgi:hypothetical protein
VFGTLAAEVKTVTGNEIDSVRISNARQLDSTGLEKLFLVRFAFDFREGSGRTVPELINSLKTSLSATSPGALVLFEDRLMEAGLIPGTSGEFDRWGFTLRQAQCFRIESAFPCILESAVPSGVSEVSYSLNLAAAAKFKLTEAEMWACIHSYV